MSTSFNNLGPRLANAGGFITKKHRGFGIRVINSTGSNIAADKLVAVSGYNTTSELPKIVLADADDPTHTDVWVVKDAINNGATGYVYKGFMSAANLDTNSATAAGDPVYLSSTAGAFAHTPATRQQIVGYVLVKSATVGQIHWDVQESSNIKQTVETVAATNAISANESGKVFFLSSATEFDSTLPAMAAGLRYTFIVAAAPSGASYTITSNAANEIKGQIYTVDVNSATDPDFETAGANTITFVDSKAVAGDRVDLFCDGTNWFAYGFCSVFDAITLSDV